MGFKYNVLELRQAKNTANWHVCSHDQTSLEIICSSWECGHEGGRTSTALEMVARYKEFAGHKACENDTASNPNNQIWLLGGGASLFNQIN